MKNKIFLTAAVLLTLMVAVPGNSYAQGPKGKSFGFGLQAGDPVALSFRVWTSKDHSWDAAIGTSYLGQPHIQGGYLWHFRDAFNSRIVFLYAGVGAVVGFWDRSYSGLFIKRHGKDYWYYKGDDATGIAIAARGAFGLNIVPNNTPLDIYLEIDPIVGLSPGGFDFMGALGVRFYP